MNTWRPGGLSNMFTVHLRAEMKELYMFSLLFLQGRVYIITDSHVLRSALCTVCAPFASGRKICGPVWFGAFSDVFIACFCGVFSNIGKYTTKTGNENV